MSYNTRPPGGESVRSVWTVEDEARLQELQKRRDRIMAEHTERVQLVVSLLEVPGRDDDYLVPELIKNADAIVAALKPFCKEN